MIKTIESSINWQFYPKSEGIPDFLKVLTEIFEKYESFNFFNIIRFLTNDLKFWKNQDLNQLLLLMSLYR